MVGILRQDEPSCAKKKATRNALPEIMPEDYFYIGFFTWMFCDGISLTLLFQQYNFSKGDFWVIFKSKIEHLYKCSSNTLTK